VTAAPESLAPQGVPIFGVIYDAVSKEEQRRNGKPEGEGAGRSKQLAVRLRRDRQWAADENITIDRRRPVVVPEAVFSDDGISRSKYNISEPLPGRDEALRVLKVGHLDPHAPTPWCRASDDGLCYVPHPVEFLLTTEESRVSRKPPEEGLLFDIADSGGPFQWVQIAYGHVYDLHDDTDRNQFRRAINDAEQDSIDTSKRMKVNKLWAVDHGAWLGRAPYGARLVKIIIDTEDGPEEITSLDWWDEEGKLRHEAELLREAIEGAEDGETLRSICRRFDARGERPRDGGRWHQANLKKYMLSKTLVGIGTHRPTRITNDKRRVPAGEPREYPGHWKPLIDAERQERLREVLTDPSRRTNHGGDARVDSLVGLVRHYGCLKNGGVTKATGHKRGKADGRRAGQRGYLCVPGPPHYGCGGLVRKAEPIKLLVHLAFCFAVDNDLFDAARAGADADAGNDDLRKLRALQDRDQGLLDGLESKIADELISKETAKRKRAEYLGRMALRAGRLAALGGPQVTLPDERGEDLYQGMGVADVARRLGLLPADAKPQGKPWPPERQHSALAGAIQEVGLRSPGSGNPRSYDLESVEIVWREEPDPSTEAVLWKHLAQATAERRPTHCPQDHEYTPENTSIDTRGTWHCRRCGREAQAAYRARKRQPGPAIETLACADCGREFQRLLVPGPKPKYCPECRSPDPRRGIPQGGKFGTFSQLRPGAPER
jgi:Recombinase